jgi:hypothetical protein
MAEQGVAPAGARESAASSRPAWPALRWVACFVLLAAIVAVTAWAGLWFVPFIAGVAAGVASLRWRRMVLLAATAAVVGWAVPLWVLALRGLPVGATARTIASLAGLPPYAPVTIVVTLLLAALQALAGAWLARAVLPRTWRRSAISRSRVRPRPPSYPMGVSGRGPCHDRVSFVANSAD